MTNFEKLKEEIANMTLEDMLYNESLYDVLCARIPCKICAKHNGCCGACIKDWFNSEVQDG